MLKITDHRESKLGLKNLTGDADPFLVPRGHNSSQIAGRVLHDLYGKEPLATRVGGSIPVMSTLLSELGIHATMFAFGLDDEKYTRQMNFLDFLALRKVKLDIVNFWKNLVNNE